MGNLRFKTRAKLVSTGVTNMKKSSKSKKTTKNVRPISFWVTAKEFKTLKSSAHKNEMSMSDFVRKALSLRKS
jgi:hypothetical protein